MKNTCLAFSCCLISYLFATIALHFIQLICLRDLVIIGKAGLYIVICSLLLGKAILVIYFYKISLRLIEHFSKIAHLHSIAKYLYTMLLSVIFVLMVYKADISIPGNLFFIAVHYVVLLCAIFTAEMYRLPYWIFPNLSDMRRNAVDPISPSETGGLKSKIDDPSPPKSHDGGQMPIETPNRKPLEGENSTTVTRKCLID